MRRRPRYVDLDACTACTDCVQVCPVEYPDEYELGAVQRRAIYRAYAQAVPSCFAITKRGKAPCRNACPIDQAAQGYVALIAEGEFKEALALIRKQNPLPGVCGRVCHHPCEEACVRGEVDAAVSIRALKRFAADWEVANEPDYSYVDEYEIERKDERAAVIGAGPAGLTCAHDLALAGYEVHVFEALPFAGGMLRVGIPTYRLPRDVLARDVGFLEKLGVQFHYDAELGKTFTLDDLFEDGYRAAFVGVGAHESLKLGCAGEELEGVVGAVEFLREFNQEGKVSVGKKVAVIGGGNAAVDAARTARRLGADVTIFYRRTRNEMPADELEVEEALREGVGLELLTAPDEILGKGSRVVGMRVQRMELGEPDESGRRRPVAIEGDTFDVELDMVIPAISQAPAIDHLDADEAICLTKWRTVEVDEKTGMTGRPGVFAGGDVVTGPGMVTEAMAQGRRAARGIIDYLNGGEYAVPEPSSLPVVESEDVPKDDAVPTPRAKMFELPPEKREGNFDEVELGLTEEQAVAEAKRCLSCGICAECLECVAACKPEAIRHFDTEKTEEIPVGAVIVATGFDEFDPRVMRNYGYGVYDNVMTSLEFERMLSASGPTQGQIVRPTDRKPPKRIVYIQCVGARGEGGQHFCSRFCCMNAVKDAMLAKIHDPSVESMTILYTDLRAFGKGFEQFVERSREVDEIHYVRGRPAKIVGGDGGTLTVYAEDTLAGTQIQLEADLVVLSVAARPNETTRDLAEALGIELDPYGFIRKRNPDCFYLETTRDGIYLCGSAGGPQVIPDCVAQASGAAALAAKHVALQRVPDEVVKVEPVDTSGEPRVGVFICHCGANIAGLLDIQNLVDHASQLEGVVCASDELFACSDSSQRVIQDAILEHKLNRLVVAACTPRTHEPVFRKACEAVGLNAYLFEMVNIRDQCSWVHVGEPEAALARARDQIAMAAARARRLEPLHMIDVPVEPAALVVGGGVAGLQAALEIAHQGFKTIIVEKTDKLGGRLNKPSLTKLYPTGRDAEKLIGEKMAGLEEAGVEIMLDTEVTRADGFVGNFDVELADPSGKRKGTATEMRAGAIVLAVGAGLYDPAGEYGYGEYANVITSLELEQNFAANAGRAVFDWKHPENVAFIQCVGSKCEGGNPGCSRYCCPTTIKQAMMLREHGANVTVFYKDIRTISDGAEEMYRAARGNGVLFVKIAEYDRAEVIGDKAAAAVEAYDVLLKSRVRAPADLVVLSTGMVPREPDTTILQSIFKIPRGEDKFLMERHPELGPVETTTDGVFIVGCLQAPKDIADSLSQASAAAAKVARLLARDTVKLEPAIAEVNEELCRGCGQCAEICRFNAPGLVQLESGVYVARVNKAVCKGCGTCAVWCPTGAIMARHFTDLQVHAMLETALQREKVDDAQA